VFDQRNEALLALSRCSVEAALGTDRSSDLARNRLSSTHPMRAGCVGVRLQSNRRGDDEVGRYREVLGGGVDDTIAAEEHAIRSPAWWKTAS